jgi:flagellar basal-body rod protein FlgB
MFLDRFLNQGSTPVLEKWLQFTEARQKLLAEDVVNISTPDFVQKDLSVDQFQSLLLKKVDQQDEAGGAGVDFNDISSDIQNPAQGMLFHDGNNRSVDQLMSDQAKNALMHNFAVELLRQQIDTLQLALKERVS